MSLKHSSSLLLHVYNSSISHCVFARLLQSHATQVIKTLIQCEILNIKHFCHNNYNEETEKEQ